MGARFARVMSERTVGPRARLVRSIMIDLTIMTVIGVVLGVIGPFGSADMPLAPRLLSWLMFAYVGYAVFRPMWLLVDWLHRLLHLPVPGLWLAGCLLASLPLTAIIWYIQYWPGPIPMPSLEQGLSAYFNVFVVGASIAFIFELIARAEGGPRLIAGGTATVKDGGAEVSAVSEASSGAPFLNRLSPALGSELLALEMEDHYVRAHTRLGSDLVLMRMRDAVAELDGLEGEQVHRSWWVARDAVAGVTRDGRNLRLQLDNGLEAPVARNRVPELKQLGWI